MLHAFISRCSWSVIVVWKFSLSGRVGEHRHEETLLLDVPCARCGRALRGVSPAGQCAECGLEVARSLSLAVVRSGDVAQLDRLATGLDAQVWSSLLAMIVCVASPILFCGSLQLHVALTALAVLMSGVGAWFMVSAEPADASHQVPLLHKVFWRLGIPLGTVSLVIVGMGVHVHLFKMESTLLTLCVSSCLCWFAAESSKLHFLELVTRLVPNMQVQRQARHVRWGEYVLLTMLAVALVQSMLEMSAFGLRMPVLRDMFVVMVSVALLVFTILTVLLYSRMSQALQQHVRHARLLSSGAFSPMLVQGVWLPPGRRHHDLIAQPRCA